MSIEFTANPRGWLARQRAAHSRLDSKYGIDRSSVREQRRQHLAGQKRGTDYIAENEEYSSGDTKKIKDLTRDELISILVISDVDFSTELSDHTLRRKLRRHLDAPA